MCRLAIFIGQWKKLGRIRELVKIARRKGEALHKTV